MEKKFESIKSVSLSSTSHAVSDVPRIDPIEEGSVTIKTGDYAIAIINMSSKCLTISGFRRRGGSDAEWKWSAIPRTCKNCNSSYDQCFRDKRWSVIETIGCTASPYELFVGYFVSENEVKGAIIDVSPRCDIAGGVWGFTD